METFSFSPWLGLAGCSVCAGVGKAISAGLVFCSEASCQLCSMLQGQADLPQKALLAHHVGKLHCLAIDPETFPDRFFPKMKWSSCLPPILPTSQNEGSLKSLPPFLPHHGKGTPVVLACAEVLAASGCLSKS